MGVKIRSRLEIRSRTYFSIGHIQSAALFTRLSHKIEKNYDGRFSPELDSECRSYVTGAIFAAVAFLEATINEFLMDITDKSVEKRQHLEQKDITMIANLWARDIFGRLSTLEKYQIALILAGKEIFDTNINPYQDVSYLVKLRNALIHYEPEWIIDISEINEIEPHKFESMLKGKFNLNPIAGDGNPFYPHKCLGHGCAEWAVNSSIKFVDEFFGKRGTIPIFNHIRGELETKI